MALHGHRGKKNLRGAFRAGSEFAAFLGTCCLRLGRGQMKFVVRQGFVVSSGPSVWAGSGLGWPGPGPDLEGCQRAGFARAGAGPGGAGPVLGQPRPGWAGTEARAHWVRPGQAQDFFFTASSLNPDCFFTASARFLKYTSFYDELLQRDPN